MQKMKLVRTPQAQGGLRALTLRAGLRMYPRNSEHRGDRVTRDHTVLALRTHCPDGEPGWSFKRRGVNEGFWYVREEDVAEEDFLDSENYRDSRGKS